MAEMTPRERLTKLRRLKELRAKAGIGVQAQQGVPQGQVAQQPISQGQQPPQEQPGFFQRAGQEIVGGVETAAALGSAALAEPLAGFAGLGALPTGGSEAGAQDIAQIREEMTFQPRTAAGQRNIQAIGKVLSPIAKKFEEAETTLGDATFEETGSSALAAAATTIPTLGAELAGIGLFKGILKGGAKLKVAGQEKAITKAIGEAAPTTDELFSTSSAIFKEIDELGVTVQQSAYNQLVRKLQAIGKKRGIDKDITPDSAKALKRFEELQGSEVPLTDLDTLRKVTQGAASSIKRPDKAIAVQMIDAIDEFLETAGTKGLKGPEGSVEQIGSRYRVARQLWGRARRSEDITNAIEAAKETASGFENGIRIELRKIIKRNAKTKYYNAAEIKEMQKVVRGTKGANIAKLIGKLGFSENQATSFLGGSIGAAAGAQIAGPIGAFAVPFIGTLSKRLATRLTKGNAKFAEQVVRAGKDARAITKAYFDNTPKAKRSTAELNELLLGAGAR